VEVSINDSDESDKPDEKINVWKSEIRIEKIYVDKNNISGLPMISKLPD